MPRSDCDAGGGIQWITDVPLFAWRLCSGINLAAVCVKRVRARIGGDYAIPMSSLSIGLLGLHSLHKTARTHV